MRDYIILNGVNSNTITGLLISTLPPITKPKIRTQTEEIDGRDGDIVTKLGYSAYDKEIEIGLYGNFDINEVIAYFNTEGTIVFSNEPDKYYNYQIIDQIDYEKLIRFKTAKVKMHVQPFKYPLVETPVEINIQNVTGSGETISLDNTGEAPLTLALKGNTSQDGTPTPDAPVEVNTVTGRQEVVICKKNMFNSNLPINNTWINSQGGLTTIAGCSIQKILCEPNTTYTLSATWEVDDTTYNGGIIVFYDKEGNMLSRNPMARKNDMVLTATSPANTNYMYAGHYVAKPLRIQLEKGSTATAYEPYQSQSYELDLGKNLVDFNNIINGQSSVSHTWENDILTVESTTGTYREAHIDITNLIKNNAGKKIRLDYDSIDFSQSNAPTVNLQVVNNGATNYPTMIAPSGTISTYTIPSDTTGITQVYLRFMPNNSNTSQAGKIVLTKPILHFGDTATTYAPYKTPIEVNYIPNTEYQDYIYKDNNKWYIKRKIGKVVLDGTETGWSLDATNNVFINNSTLFNGQYLVQNALSNYFGNVVNENITGNYQASQYLQNNQFSFRAGTKDRLYLKCTSITSANDLKTWLGTHNTVIYYVLTTPEDEEITDNTLIGQLNTIEANARSYDTTTNISQNTPNKPFIINATAVKKGTDTGTVNNIGNIYAKPTIDIEGLGIADIYLNNNQIFSVDLSTSNECIIDTANLEAYNPDTSQLMNRQVTGDYSNFNINVGENTVKISGSVTKATISNYTRWL